MLPQGRVFRIGAIAGAVSIYLALVGLLERFADLDLADLTAATGSGAHGDVRGLARLVIRSGTGARQIGRAHV